MDLLLSLNMQGIAVIIVNHNEKIANKCNRLVELKDGQIIKDQVTRNQ